MHAAILGVAGGLTAAGLGAATRGLGARAQRAAFSTFEAGSVAGAYLTGFSRAGLKGGLVASGVTTLTRLAFLGKRVRPDRTYGAFDGLEPCYRGGTRFWGKGSGIALGRTLVARTTGRTHYDHFLLAHETAHYQQQIDLGIARFYGRILLEYLQIGFRNTYHTSGTLEYAANAYADSFTAPEPSTRPSGGAG